MSPSSSSASESQSYNLLISNDDGISAVGVRVLANTLAAAGHQVTVVCPDQERSATGHGLTLHHPIRTELVTGIFAESVTAWACSGTPSDCIKFALNAIVTEQPDFVLAGINHGANLGTDVLYSGTVSAAMEGTLEDIPSVAFSLADYTAHNFQPTADFACRLLQQLPQQAIAPATLLNVNVPNLVATDIKGVKITRQGLRRYIEQFQKRQDPRGKTYYWLAGEAIEELPQPNVCQTDVPDTVITDVEAIAQGFITITPLQYIMNDVTAIKTLSTTHSFS